MHVNSQHLGQLVHVAGVLERAAQDASQRDATLYLKTAQALQSRVDTLKTGAATAAAPASPAPQSKGLVDILA
jgi:hypothetical protein